MTIFKIPVASALAWLLAFALAGAGIVNATGGAAVQADFIRWGYPRWWNIVTAAVEILGAGLIVLPETRVWGLVIEAMVLVAAIATVTWRGDYKHLPPAVVLTALTGIELALVAVH